MPQPVGHSAHSAFRPRAPDLPAGAEQLRARCSRALMMPDTLLAQAGRTPNVATTSKRGRSDAPQGRVGTDAKVGRRAAGPAQHTSHCRAALRSNHLRQHAAAAGDGAARDPAAACSRPLGGAPLRPAATRLGAGGLFAAMLRPLVVSPALLLPPLVLGPR